MNQVRSRKLAVALIAVAIFFLICSALYDTTPRSIKGSEIREKPKVLVTFLAIGKSKQRQELIKKNLDALEAQRETAKTKYHIDCLLLSWANYNEEPDWVHKIERNSSHFCKVRRLTGFSYVAFIKTLVPDMLEAAGYKYMSLIMDDIGLTAPYGSYSIPTLLDVVMQHNLSMASPAVVGSDHPAMRPTSLPNPGQIGRYTNSIEIQALTLRMDAWSCLWELYDLQYPSGWGPDIWFEEYCVKTGRVPERSVALLDSMAVTHNPFKLQSTNGDKAKLTKIFEEQIKGWKEERGIALKKSDLTSLGPLLKRS